MQNLNVTTIIISLALTAFQITACNATETGFTPQPYCGEGDSCFCHASTDKIDHEGDLVTIRVLTQEEHRHVVEVIEIHRQIAGSQRQVGDIEDVWLAYTEAPQQLLMLHYIGNRSQEHYLRIDENERVFCANDTEMQHASVSLQQAVALSQDVSCYSSVQQLDFEDDQPEFYPGCLCGASSDVSYRPALILGRVTEQSGEHTYSIEVLEVLETVVGSAQPPLHQPEQGEKFTLRMAGIPTVGQLVMLRIPFRYNSEVEFVRVAEDEQTAFCEDDSALQFRHMNFADAKMLSVSNNCEDALLTVAIQGDYSPEEQELRAQCEESRSNNDCSVSASGSWFALLLLLLLGMSVRARRRHLEAPRHRGV